VNLTKTVHKYPLDKDGNIVGKVVRDFPDPKYEELKDDGVPKAQEDKAATKSADAEPPGDQLTSANFAEALNNSPILMVRSLPSPSPRTPAAAF
jgi:hypothetical protein